MKTRFVLEKSLNFVCLKLYEPCIENDLKGNENWFELARVRVIDSQLYNFWGKSANWSNYLKLSKAQHWQNNDCHFKVPWSSFDDMHVLPTPAFFSLKNSRPGSTVCLTSSQCNEIKYAGQPV